MGDVVEFGPRRAQQAEIEEARARHFREVATRTEALITRTLRLMRAEHGPDAACVLAWRYAVAMDEVFDSRAGDAAG